MMLAKYIPAYLNIDGLFVKRNTADEMRERIEILSEKLPERFQLVLCLVMIGAGICCMVMTDRIHHDLPVILGILLFVAGFIAVLASFRVEERYRYWSEALLFLILGIMMFAKQDGSDYRIGVIWGMIGLIRNSRSLMENAGRKKVLPAIISLAGLIISTVLLADPPSHLHFHIFLLGLELVVLGAAGLTTVRKE